MTPTNYCHKFEHIDIGLLIILDARAEFKTTSA